VTASSTPAIRRMATPSALLVECSICSCLVLQKDLSASTWQSWPVPKQCPCRYEGNRCQASRCLPSTRVAQHDWSPGAACGGMMSPVRATRSTRAYQLVTRARARVTAGAAFRSIVRGGGAIRVFFRCAGDRWLSSLAWDPVAVANSGRKEECPRRHGSHSQPPPVWLEVLADLRGTLGAIRHVALASDAREVRTAVAAVGA
jgi:hypothetical protein